MYTVDSDTSREIHAGFKGADPVTPGKRIDIFKLSISKRPPHGELDDAFPTRLVQGVCEVCIPLRCLAQLSGRATCLVSRTYRCRKSRKQAGPGRLRSPCIKTIPPKMRGAMRTHRCCAGSDRCPTCRGHRPDNLGTRKTPDGVEEPRLWMSSFSIRMADLAASARLGCILCSRRLGFFFLHPSERFPCISRRLTG